MALTTIDATPALVLVDLQKHRRRRPPQQHRTDLPRLGETATAAEVLDMLERTR